ncbi:hypothetical protein VNO78_28874 [Psophocarpus tetragonolobus]|uniref:Uncharacterized protein n=1 Tax=Psophocarpus tetragonolobus TaxID=3891 RepID=A0AAN9RUG7_PSOTE
MIVQKNCIAVYLICMYDVFKYSYIPALPFSLTFMVLCFKMRQNIFTKWRTAKELSLHFSCAPICADMKYGMSRVIIAERLAPGQCVAFIKGFSLIIKHIFY